MDETASVPSQPRHLAAGAALSTIAEVGPFISVGVLSVVLARVLGPAGNGAFAVIVTAVDVAVLLFSLGLSAGITFEVSAGRWAIGRALSASYPLAFVLGLAGTAAGFGFYALTRHTVMHAVGLPVAAVGLAAVPALLAAQFALSILLGRDRYEAYAVVQLLGAAAVLMVAAGLAVPFGLQGAIIGVAVSAIVAAVAGAVLVRRSAKSEESAQGHKERGRDRRPLRAALRFGLTAWIGNLLQQANYRFDVLILGAYASAAHVGVYSVALALTSIAWFLPHGIQTVIFPRTANLDAAAQAGAVTSAESDAAVTRGTRHSVLLLVPSGAIVAVLLAVVPLVYGSGFRETVSLGFVLLPGVLALGVGKVLGSVVAGRGAVRYNLYTGMMTALITLGLYFWLIPLHHEWGAAIASSISYFATAAIAVVFFRRQLNIPLSQVLIPTRADLRNYPEALAALAAHVRARRRQRFATPVRSTTGRR